METDDDMAAYLNSWPDTVSSGGPRATDSGPKWSSGTVATASGLAVASLPGDPSEDRPLFARIAAGDGEAFAVFYDRYSSLFFGLAWRILGDDQESEDVVQEACVSLWERAPQYDASLGKPLSWAVTIVRNRAIDRHRSRKRRAAVFAAADNQGETPEPAVELRPTPPTDLADTATLVRQTLTDLPKPQREALDLAFFGGLTHLEIAQHLAVPLGTIKARIRRGLLALRDTLEGRL